jgi:hypothetical protein
MCTSSFNPKSNILKFDQLLGKSDNMHVWHKFSITRFVSECIQIIFIWLKFAKVENFNLERQLKVHLFEDQGSIYVFVNFCVDRIYRTGNIIRSFNIS